MSMKKADGCYNCLKGKLRGITDTYGCRDESYQFQYPWYHWCINHIKKSKAK